MDHTPNRTDKYYSTSLNPATGQKERKWIQYADGVFEPVRTNGNLSRKWRGGPSDHAWWCVQRPEGWRPADDGYGHAWNHNHGEADKPMNWGDKHEHEIKGGSSPYYLRLELNDKNKIDRKTERIDGRRETWEFTYDGAGRLTDCLSDTGWQQEFEYDDEGRRTRDYEVGRTPLMRKYTYTQDDRLLSAGHATYEHDENGFRTACVMNGKATRYEYSPDCRLLGVDMPDGRIIRFDHDEHGMRRKKLVNNSVAERYGWLDFYRLGTFKDANNIWELHYAEGDRVPILATINGDMYDLHYDQCGSLKAVVDDTGNVVKAIQYGPFGDVLRDSAPGLRVPLGYGGGLYDSDTGFVRLGWRDYDPATGRWTARDPMGDAGGDPDWYGYCLDDPVNNIDPTGLLWGEIGDAIGGFFSGLGNFASGLFSGGKKGKEKDAPKDKNKKKGGYQIRGTAADIEREMRAKQRRDEAREKADADDKARTEKEEEEAYQTRRRAMDEENLRDKRAAYAKYGFSLDEEEPLGSPSEPLGGEPETMGNPKGPDSPHAKAATEEEEAVKPDKPKDDKAKELSKAQTLSSSAPPNAVTKSLLGPNAEEEQKSKAYVGSVEQMNSLLDDDEMKKSMGLSLPDTDFSVDEEEEEKDAGEKSESPLERQDKMIASKSWFDPKDVAIPPGVNMRTNALTASAIKHATLASPLSQGLKYLGTYLAFKNNGPFDYKQKGKQYETFGNIHYGLITKALGIPEEVAERLAGWAQQRAGTSDPAWGSPLSAPPYGDDPKDNLNINKGFDLLK